MRVFAALLAAVFVSLAPEAALAERAAQSEIVEIQVPAPSLASNLLGTPTVQPASVYLPPSYNHQRALHYPTLYLLHGYADTRAAWLNYLGVKAILDRDIAGHRIPEVIVVMPDATNAYGGGFYVNSPVSGHWGDYITDDLMHYVDTHYRTLARPSARGLIGWSMGGFGAIHIAMERPGLYSAVYAISPCCLAPVEDLGAASPAWSGVLAVHTQADVQAAAEHHDFYTVAAMALLTAISPDPNAAPLYVRIPFKEHDGQIAPDSAAYDHYQQQFPLYRIAQSRDALAGLRAFGMDYGFNDQYAHIPPSVRAFSDRLSEYRIPHRFEAYDGDHRDHVAARLETIVLPYVAGALDAPQ
ncbi:MAG: alpha/beta hydrolase-fold protein [Pseudomonadota bacterium]